VVEDTEFFRELAKETLSRDYRTILAATASDALGALAAERVDLVVLDLALEAEDDGLPVLDAASRRGIPVLVFTASDDSDLQYGRGWGSLRARGASDLLVKAMNVEDRLREKVAALVGPGAG
jgi:CheY-like chemotaxis protein